MLVVLVPIVILALMWAFVIVPQQRRVRAHRSFAAGLHVGDDVITTSGLYGEIVDIDDETVRLRLAPDAVVTIARLAIARPQRESEPAADAVSEAGGTVPDPEANPE